MTKVEGWEVLTFNQKILSMLSLHYTYLSLSNLVDTVAESVRAECCQLSAEVAVM